MFSDWWKSSCRSEASDSKAFLFCLYHAGQKRSTTLALNSGTLVS